MRRVVALGQFVWDFVVGDDWRIAVGVALALGLTAVIAGAGTAAWWVMPAAVLLILTASVWRVARRRRSTGLR
jgi:hypothetical protein